MAHPQKWLYAATSGKIFLLLSLLFLITSAYDSSSSSSSEEDDDSQRFISPAKRYSRIEEEEMAKRALSLLAHWRPQFLGLPKVNTRSDIVSAVTRGGRPSRPLGQPLRWG
ncbi:hypothetical protein JTE90_024960 [Oedothorax gibbosus]|uniref:Uncharacterized protein n=1 Tax=Oedothorax gibbosus TaxID=931172 RepID=A0AAV6VU22_9ARAC|nr:hypothetical protein JTE90_024960 [Oedothorax gibbosus]